jgi:alkanesulfonate monooxygenase SsuD/methylene tetrahydromethanopterin reductase-like flavin-dependent oxidoreductase (luciferase family)
MRFGTFLFTHAGPKGRDHELLKETLAEARAAEEHGMDAVWLAEHHFDGTLAYVDPVSFAAALAMHTKRVKIGTAVIQAALHHPIRVAEQLSLIDHLSEGRLIAGFGKGTMYNPYEYAAFGVDPEIAAERFDELEEVILKCWSGERVTHKGKFFEVDIPMMRPCPFTLPHPPLIRACGNDGAAAAQARLGRPFLMAGTDEVVFKRVAAYRAAAKEAGRAEADVARALDQSWCWKNVIIADTDAEAEAIAVETFQATLAYRAGLGMASRYVDQYKASGVRVPPGYAFGTAETVAAKLAPMRETGIGGLILRFRHGPMPLAQAVRSMEAFVRHVAPALNAPAAAAAQ